MNVNENVNENENQIRNWFLFKSVLTLISGVTFGKVYEEVPSLSAITQGQAQVLILSGLLFLVGIVGLTQIMLHSHEEE